MLLEPQLAHHRAEFKRLRSRRVGIMVAASLSALVFWLLVGFLSPPKWVQLGIFVILLAGFTGIGLLTVQMFLVFRRDLRERTRARP
jgi:hypothetical protein